MNQPWTKRQRPERLERRIEFTDYDRTRDFLERLSNLSEITQRFPDISFGRTYVNLTLHTTNNQLQIDGHDHQFAQQIDQLVSEFIIE